MHLCVITCLHINGLSLINTISTHLCHTGMYYPTEEQWCCHPQHSKKAMLCGWIIISSTRTTSIRTFAHHFFAHPKKPFFERSGHLPKWTYNHARVQPRHIAASTSSSSYRCTFRHTPTSPLPKKPTSTA